MRTNSSPTLSLKPSVPTDVGTSPSKRATLFEPPFFKGGPGAAGGGLKAMPAGRQGFTMIEMVVIVSIMAVIMVTIVSILINTFQARNRVDVTDVLEQNGSYVLAQITNDFLNSDGANAICNGDSLLLTSKTDGNATEIKCNETVNIASNSASLTQGVTASNCANFVSCDITPDGSVAAVNISFTLSTGVPQAGVENYSSRSFTAKVAVRN